jgi:AcrR family transcriptional regulator
MGRRPEINGRELLVAAALKLFAAEGVDAVSIRAINREAGLGPASIHYHFGTKDALVDAVVEVYAEQVRADIAARAEQLTKKPVVSARDLVTMMAQPYLDLVAAHAHAGRDWIRLISQLAQLDPERGLGTKAARAARGAIRHAYGEVSPARADRALGMCFRLLIAQLAQAPVRTGGARAASDLEFLLEFLSGGLDAAMTASEADTERSA